MEETREHPAVEPRSLEEDELPDVTGAAILLLRGRLPRVRAGKDPTTISLLVNGSEISVDVEYLDSGLVQFQINGRRYRVEFEESVPISKKTASKYSGQVVASSNEKVLRAPIPGVVSALLVETGATVDVSDPVLRLEAMKMQNAIPAGRKGTVKKIYVSVGQEIAEGEALLEIE